MSTHMFVCRHCGRELELDHHIVADGLAVQCHGCGAIGRVYIDADDDGIAYAGVSWDALEPADKAWLDGDDLEMP